MYQTVSAPRLPYGGQSIKVAGKSGPDGRYALSLAHLPPGEYSAHAYQVVVNGQRQLTFSLVAADTKTFGGHQAAVRDFRRVMVESSPDMPYGNAGIFVIENAVMDYTDLASAVVTLSPQAGGPSTVRMVRRTGEGLVVTGVAFGTYRASARLGGKPLLLQLRGSDAEFTQSVVHDFTMGYLGNQLRVFAKLP